MGLPIEFPNQNLRRIGPGDPKLWSDKQTDRQTNREYNFIYIYQIVIFLEYWVVFTVSFWLGNHEYTSIFEFLNNLFQAGSETTATTLRWAVLYLVLYPEVQQRMQVSKQKDLSAIGTGSTLKCNQVFSFGFNVHPLKKY